MAKYFTNVPKEHNHGQTIDNLINLYHRDNLENLHSNSDIRSSSTKSIFIMILLRLEGIFNDFLKEQAFYEGTDRHINDYPFKTEYFHTKQQEYKTVFQNEGYTPIPSLQAALSTPTYVFYKDNHLAICAKERIKWEDLYKILAFRYELIKQTFKDKGLFVDARFSELYRALANNDAETADKIFITITEDKLLKKARFARFKKFFKPRTERKIKEIKMTLASLSSDLEAQLAAYTRTVTAIEKTNEEYEYLINKKEDDISQECINYLVKIPYLQTLYERSSNELELYFEAPLLYYDEAVIDKLIARGGSNRRKILLNTFKDKDYTLWTRCKLAFNTDTFNITALRIDNSPQLIAHPHIARYGCTGNHPNEVREWVKSGDYIGALTQITAAVLNLNFYDGIVIGTMIDTITHTSCSDIPTFKDNATGNFVSFNDILNKKGL